MNNDFLNSLCCPRFCSYHFPPSDVSFSAWNVLILCAPSDQTHITGEGYVLLCKLVHSGTKPLQLQEMAEVLLCRNCSPALWVRICSYIPYYEYTDELHTGVQKEIKCNFLKFFCARACPMGSDHAPNWWDLMPSQEQNQLPRVILIETNIGWTLALFMKQANELLWAFCHCWDSLQCTRTLIAVDTGAVIKACAQSGKSPHTESEKTSCTVKPLETCSWPWRNTRCEVLVYISLGLRHHSLGIMSQVNCLVIFDPK